MDQILNDEEEQEILEDDNKKIRVKAALIKKLLSYTITCQCAVTNKLNYMRDSYRDDLGRHEFLMLQQKEKTLQRLVSDVYEVLESNGFTKTVYPEKI